MLRFVLAALVAYSAAPPAPQGEVTILPLGDSITEGSSHFSNYRVPLGRLLSEAGIPFRFVGSRHTEGEPERMLHEGYGGKTAEFLADHFERLYSANRADIILLHAGHNHFSEEHPVPGILAATERIVVAARRINPRVTICLAMVIPSGKLPKYEYIPKLNRGLAELAQRLNTPSQPVIAVDQASGFDWLTDTVSDLVHPNRSGAEKMARQWLAAIKSLL